VDVSAWSDKTTGEARASLELRARNVQFLGARSERVEAPEAGAPEAPETEEDIPF
jgi:hypothetical protein